VQPQVLVLRDGNNAIIGEVAAFKNDGNIISSVEIVYRGDPIDAVFFEDFPLAVLRVWFFPERYGPDPIWAAWEDETIAVYFTSTNCTGTPYLRYFKFVNIAFDFPRLSIADVSGGGQDIFVPLDVTETPTNRTTGSTYSQSTGLCEGQEVNYDLITGTRVHVNFPRPYTVGF
jgi:hypothetical protein